MKRCQLNSSRPDRVRRGVATALLTLFAAPLDGAVSSVVDDLVEEAVAAAVEESVVEQVQAQAAATVEEQVTQQVVDSTLQQVEASVTGALDDVVSGQVAEQTTGAVLNQVQSTVESTLSGELELGETLTGTVSQVLDGTSAQGVADAGEAVLPFATTVDPAGRPIETGVLMLLVHEAELPVVRALGMPVRRQVALEGLGRVLVRLEVDPAVPLAQAAAQVRAASRTSVVDFNHLYGVDSQNDNAEPTASPGNRTVSGAADASKHGADGLVLGVIDTALDIGHPGVRRAGVIQQDFVAGNWVRPMGHGTAVASILVAATGAAAGNATPTLYAASVFFEHSPGQMTATAESILKALSWLRSQNVDVINMSLTGPPNALLEAAVETTGQAGAWVVAAVGNNGPAGEPLYPAAYEGVIGVTAVDSKHRVFTYANRGRQVTFAAPGVGVRVARHGGGFGNDNGTSLASAYAAVVLAATRRDAARRGIAPTEVLAQLKRAALDLGVEGFDETYGYGLIGPLPAVSLAAEGAGSRRMDAPAAPPSSGGR